MKKPIMIIAAILLLTPGIGMADDAAWGDVAGGTFAEPEQAAPATPKVAATAPDGTVCGQDDPRMQNLIAVLKDVKAGSKVKPLQMSFGTYMGLSDKVRKMLGDNIIISTADCKKQFIFEGALTGKVEMPFPEAMTYINNALRARDTAKLKFVFTNMKAAPDTLNNILSYSVAKEFDLETGKVLVHAANILPLRSNEKLMGILLLDIYQALGGRLAQGEKNKVYIYSLGVNYFASAVSSDEDTLIKIGSEMSTYGGGNKITSIISNRLMGIYAAIGMSSEVTKVLPTK
ncbi:MAG: hypothetical protein Q9M28_09920 [Mariprofundaceae bacterium]|nr:hypothetical protein [Mariprofundaceae bacterium]